MKQKIIILGLFLLSSLSISAQQQKPLAKNLVKKGAFWKKNPCGDHIGKISKYIHQDKGKKLPFDGIYDINIDGVIYTIYLDRITFDEIKHILFAETQCGKKNYTVDSKNYLDARGGNIWYFVNNPAQKWFDTCSNLVSEVVTFKASEKTIVTRKSKKSYENHKKKSTGVFENSIALRRDSNLKDAIPLRDTSVDFEKNQNLNIPNQTYIKESCLVTWLKNPEYRDIYREYLAINGITENSRYQWRRGFNLNMFDRISDRKTRRAFKNCATNTNWLQRHVFKVATVGAVITAGVIYLIRYLARGNSSGSTPDNGGWDFNPSSQFFR